MKCSVMFCPVNLFVIERNILLEMPLTLRHVKTLLCVSVIRHTSLCVSVFRDRSVFRDFLQRGWSLEDAIELEDAMPKGT